MNIELILAKKVYWLYFQNLAKFHLLHCCQATVTSPLDYHCNSFLSVLSPKGPLSFTCSNMLASAFPDDAKHFASLHSLHWPLSLSKIPFLQMSSMACFLSSILSLINYYLPTKFALIILSQITNRNFPTPPTHSSCGILNKSFIFEHTT